MCHCNHTSTVVDDIGPSVPYSKVMMHRVYATVLFIRWVRGNVSAGQQGTRGAGHSWFSTVQSNWPYYECAQQLKKIII